MFCLQSETNFIMKFKQFIPEENFIRIEYATDDHAGRFILQYILHAEFFQMCLMENTHSSFILLLPELNKKLSVCCS
jgi:hypothetical protein